MGFTALARWNNAPTTAIELINQNIIRNHQGQYRGRWQSTVRSYRSTMGSVPGFQVHAERSMCTLSMDENVFVLLEDTAAPARAEYLQQIGDPAQSQLPGPTHYRHTFLTLSPPGSLEQLLAQLRARWVSVRQASQPTSSQKGTGQQLVIDGHIYAIGNDWLVRAGNVILAGGAVKGMLLEAEYLPLPTMPTAGDGTPELLSNLLISVLPNVADPKIVAVAVSDSIWEEALWDTEDEEVSNEEKTKMLEQEDDIYVSEEDSPASRKGDWVYGARGISTAVHFYQNRQLEQYASKEAQRLTLRQLVFFGRSMNEDRLIKSANYVRTELPVRIAHRLRDLQALPYVVVTQEGVAKVYELYWSAFDKFRRYPQIKNLAENEAFCTFLRGLLDEHKTVIPNLSLGLSLSSPYLAPDRLDSFMRRMLVSRISRRVLAEHHIALSKAMTSKLCPTDRVGIICTGLKVKDSIEKCARFLRKRRHDVDQDPENGIPSDAEWSEVIVDGHVDTRFAYIREHLEYIIFELLKNSFRATRFRHPDTSVLPPIRATVVAGENDVCIRISDQGGGLLTPEIKSPSDLFSFSHVRNATRLADARLGALRSVSVRGMTATVDEQVTAWQRATNAENPQHGAGIGSHPRIGIGLPMSNIFATYFGGSLELVSLDGYGTDVYLRLPKLGTNLEGIEL
ncbi:[3-methyl-2-oxobutanoate dehydrogenase [lipoamide]] kinase, mitochondrial [Grifola frondosa]|uniref:Protein-serine/threonine kinase n=1 Tax=Grifola frondosa TaxID=5627 RepID=A0A1C7M222_GRIFR|nr:[3-methyl-2-oxobutanoate dehydrogenase [lipoamide]] kinase, mitochondrial [Grifola frondosa]